MHSFTLKVLYIFCGKPRRADIREYLQNKCSGRGWVLHMDEIDIERNAADDCIDDAVWARILNRVANSEFQVAIVSPPCNKWSRAPWSNENGPSPCRSSVWPMGFPWATGLQLQKCEESNLLVLRALEICEVAFHAGTAYVLEHPEDLGVLQDGGDPASIWQLPRTTEVAKSTKAVCAALLQCSFGAPTAKPTRLMRTLGRLAQLKCPRGWECRNGSSGPRGVGVPEWHLADMLSLFP